MLFWGKLLRLIRAAFLALVIAIVLRSLALSLTDLILAI